MVSASPERNFSNTEICLPFAQTDPNGKTDRFARVNGKQALFVCCFADIMILKTIFIQSSVLVC